MSQFEGVCVSYKERFLPHQKVVIDLFHEKNTKILIKMQLMNIFCCLLPKNASMRKNHWSSDIGTATKICRTYQI